MDRTERQRRLIQALLAEMPEYRAFAAEFSGDGYSQRRILRSLMNLRPPMPLDPAFLAEQDALLEAEREEKGVVEADDLTPTAADPRLVLWQGNITRLRADAIVNAANSALLGCFQPCHGCIDNAIHSAAGLQLRDDCAKLMAAQGCEEPEGRAKLTPGHALPARYVIHTVGPVVRGREPTDRDRAALASCYRSCLELAGEHGLESVAFCCISTGVYHFPHEEAAAIAVDTVKAVLDRGSTVRRVIFNVFKDLDAAVYRRLLGGDRAAESRP